MDEASNCLSPFSHSSPFFAPPIFYREGVRLRKSWSTYFHFEHELGIKQCPQGGDTALTSCYGALPRHSLLARREAARQALLITTRPTSSLGEAPKERTGAKSFSLLFLLPFPPSHSRRQVRAAFPCRFFAVFFPSHSFPFSSPPAGTPGTTGPTHVCLPQVGI